MGRVVRAMFGRLMAAVCLFAAPWLIAQENAPAPPLLTLDQAIQIAIANNISLKIANLDVDKSNWQVAAAKTRRLPNFSTNLFASGDLNSPAFTFNQGIFGFVNDVPVPSRNMRVDLSQGVTGFAMAQVAQPITQLYKIHLGIEEKRLSSDLASQQFQGKRQSVVADVKQAYYAVLQTESALKSTEATVKQYEETDRVVLQYIAQEAVLQSDSLDVKAKLAQARYQIVELRNNLQTQKEQLNYLLGRDLETDFTTEQVPPISLAETDLQGAQRTALAQRPEIKEAEINVQRADVDRKLAKSQYIPDLGVAFHYYSPLNTEILPKNVAAAGVEMNWEPFDWGRRKDEVNAKKITLEQSQYQLKDVRSKILLDVNNRFRKLDQSRQLLAVAQAAQAAATEKLREVNDQFRQSSVLLREVLQQEAAVANANHDYEQALLAFWTAKAEFERALGEE
ncbi:MAG: TolC family protein [Terriglobales bacterium]